MVQAMSTKLESVEAVVGDSFEYGVMPVPVITDETHEGALGKSVILGGQPDIIFGINKSLEEDEEKYNAALDLYSICLLLKSSFVWQRSSAESRWQTP